MTLTSDTTTHEFEGADNQYANTTERIDVAPSSPFVTLAGAVLAGALVFLVVGSGSAQKPAPIAESSSALSAPLESVPVEAESIIDQAEVNRFSTLRDLHWSTRAQSWSRAESNRFAALRQSESRDDEAAPTLRLR